MLAAVEVLDLGRIGACSELRIVEAALEGGTSLVGGELESRPLFRGLLPRTLGQGGVRGGWWVWWVARSDRDRERACRGTLVLICRRIDRSDRKAVRTDGERR